ncbi:MAG: hypothetical protein ACKVOK_13355 [Flavobacteriales bacterium]
MKYLSIIALIFFCSCGESAQPSKAKVNPTDNASKSAPTDPVQAFPIPYYLGAENSGSWALEMSMEQNGSFSVVLKDSSNGTQYQGSFQKSPPIVNGKVVVAGNESLFNGVFEGASSGLASTIRIKGEQCTSKSGFVSPSTCEIKFDNKTYTGCGKFVD